jgi:two-component system chemotaxis sensor kinase CheA
MFNFISNNTENNNRLCILIKNKDKEAAIWVDELSDQQQVVLKKLDGLPIAQSIMGGAIMGDGRVGLVLNVEGLLDNYFKK